MNRFRIGNLILRKGATMLAILLLLPFAALAVPLETYKARIDAALHRAYDLEQILLRDEIDEPRKSALIESVRRGFPSSERIEWSGGSVETSNEWLLARMNDLESATEVKTCLPIAVAVREHLTAVAFKLDEMQGDVASNRTKDEDKQKLAEILQREEYGKPQDAKESAFQRALREFLEWFLDLWPKPPATSPQGSFGFGSLAYALQYLLIAVLAGLLVFLIAKIAPLLFPTLKRAKRSKPKNRIILGEEIDEDQAASDLFGEAERLAQQGDIRAAIRKGYIALLCDLSDRRIIGLARSKTNRDYVRDVRSRRELYSQLQSATDTFERHWYGFKRSEQDDWTRFSERCKEAIRSI